jgi:hypothetical protein
MTYGRIGTAGRTKIRSFTRFADAATAVDANLRRRATLPRRIGVAHQLHSAEHGPQWPDADLSRRFARFANAEIGSGSVLP